jgi:hypothetical protein
MGNSWHLGGFFMMCYYLLMKLAAGCFKQLFYCLSQHMEIGCVTPILVAGVISIWLISSHFFVGEVPILVG